MAAKTLLLFVAGCLMSLPGAAELEQVEVGGSIEQYAAWYSPFSEPTGLTLHYPLAVPRRPLGENGLASYVRADGHGGAMSYAEQRTRLHIKAGLTDNVQAYIELDDNETWGDGDFRSDYRTGTDWAADSTDDVEIYQAYIEATELLGQPLTLKIGRQEMCFGSGWLVGTNPYSDPFTGLSFDAVRLTYAGAACTLDAWWSKLQDRAQDEEDGDTDFYGLYLSCPVTDNITFDTYWLLVRDAQSRTQTRLEWPLEGLVQSFGFDAYETTNLHTIGVRTTGKSGSLDWEMEAAYQFGNADALGVLFTPADGGYGDSEARFGNWAGQFTLGYTVDSVRFRPRGYLHGEYYGGEDRRAISIGEWMNPFLHSKASVSFNRLFSDYETHSFLDGSGLSNYYNLVIGMELALTEKLKFSLSADFAQAIKPFDWPLDARFGYWHVPLAPDLPFLTQKGSRDLGWELNLYFRYAYSEHLAIEVGGTHYCPGEGVRDGVFCEDNGMTLVGGTGDHDADYLYIMTQLTF